MNYRMAMQYHIGVTAHAAHPNCFGAHDAPRQTHIVAQYVRLAYALTMVKKTPSTTAALSN